MQDLAITIEFWESKVQEYTRSDEMHYARLAQVELDRFISLFNSKV